MILNWAHRLLCEPFRVTSGTTKEEDEKKWTLAKESFETYFEHCVAFSSIYNIICAMHFFQLFRSFVCRSLCVCQSAKRIYSNKFKHIEWDWMDCAWSTAFAHIVMNRFLLHLQTRASFIADDAGMRWILVGFNDAIMVLFSFLVFFCVNTKHSNRICEHRFHRVRITSDETPLLVGEIL